MSYGLFKMALGVLATVGLYSVLYRENRFYRFWEHLFLGLAAGWALVALWTETLSSTWWDKMVGTPPDATGGGATMGYWAYVLLIPVGLLGYAVFSRKHNWLSRIPIGIILGLYSGQQFRAWQVYYTPLIDSSMKPIFPTTRAFFHPATVGVNPPLSPAGIARIDSTVYVSQALSNLVFVVTLLSVIAYFLFSFDVKSRAVARVGNLGRLFLMIGFGAIFGSTVMMRFTLLIDRMYFVWIEFVRDGVWHGLFHR